ncbi:MAG: hypothetical protein ACREQ1_10880, partial [Woeseiaceae bacterium]
MDTFTRATFGQISDWTDGVGGMTAGPTGIVVSGLSMPSRGKACLALIFPGWNGGAPQAVYALAGLYQVVSLPSLSIDRSADDVAPETLM